LYGDFETDESAVSQWFIGKQARKINPRFVELFFNIGFCCFFNAFRDVLARFFTA
jgi:hypothetical protein